MEVVIWEKVTKVKWNEHSHTTTHSQLCIHTSILFSFDELVTSRRCGLVMNTWVWSSFLTLNSETEWLLQYLSLCFSETHKARATFSRLFYLVQADVFEDLCLPCKQNSQTAPTVVDSLCYSMSYFVGAANFFLALWNICALLCLSVNFFFITVQAQTLQRSTCCLTRAPFSLTA